MFILRDEKIKQNVIREINTLPIDGQPWTVEIHQPKKTRQQEKYFHKLLSLYCDHTGDSEEDIKRDIKFEHLPLKEMKVKIAVFDDGILKGHKDVWILEPISSTKASAKQYNMLIEDITVKCMRVGVVVPDLSFYGYNFNVD